MTILRHVAIPFRLALLAGAITLPGTEWPARGQTSLSIYTDGLVSGFQDWGWATRNYANISPVHSGTKSLSVSLESPWQGVQIVHPALDVSGYQSLSLWINSGNNSALRLRVAGLLHIGSTQNVWQTMYDIEPRLSNTWRHFTIPLSSLGVSNRANFSGIVIQDSVGQAQPVFYVDDIELVPKPAPAMVGIKVDATQARAALNERHFGINFNMWDTCFDPPNDNPTIALLQEAGFLTARMPGGLDSDGYHWASNKSFTNTWEWQASFADMVHVATNIGMQGIITVNYRTGTPEEAAAWVRHANVTNHLGYKYWEVGNECYFQWGIDANLYPFDPYTYAVRAASYLADMRAADPSIRVGVVVTPGEDTGVNQYNWMHPAYNPRTGATNIGWTPIVLTTLKNLGVTPDFLVHHLYPGWTDVNNLPAAPTDAPLLFSGSWAVDAADLRQQIADYFGPTGTNIELVCTENNCESGAAGRQTTSLVNGLYYADSFGQMSKTEFQGFAWWALRNSTDTSGYFGADVYGWRAYGDLGIVNGLNNRHPTFYAAKLLQWFARPGDRILDATSDYGWLAAYASRHVNGALALLVINKNPLGNLTAQVDLNGFVPHSNAIVRRFGIPNDEATRTNGPAAAQDITTNSFASAATSFTYSFPPYSMTLFSLVPEPPKLALISPSSPGELAFELQGQSEVPYVLQTSTNLSTWSAVATNKFTGSSLALTNTISSGQACQFWRAVWQP
jgi:hypothetical protein